jgi:hypothetical protein
MLFGLLIVACGSAPATLPSRPSGSTAGALVLLDVDESDVPGVVVLAGPGLAAHQRYVVAGPRGTALVEVVDIAPPDCDHCAQPRMSARLVPPNATLPSRTAGEVLTAIGPMDAETATLTAARTTSAPFPSPGPGWSTHFTVDIDGDGDADLERVVRCGHRTPSGCIDSVCNAYCHATQTVGAGTVRGERCDGFVADVDDCLPNDE